MHPIFLNFKKNKSWAKINVGDNITWQSASKDIITAGTSIGSGAYKNYSVNSGTKYTFRVDVKSITTAPAQLRIETTGAVLVASQDLNVGSNVITFTASGSSMNIKIVKKNSGGTTTIVFDNTSLHQTYTSYQAGFFSQTDYYSFGSEMPGRVSNQGSYRFGFNGQEMSNEIAGTGNHNTAEFWQYDTRLGRRWNLDPKPNVSISSYATFADNPIWFSDPLGDTVGYSSFRDRINVSLSRVLSKDFRKEFNVLKNSTNTYTYNRYSKGALGGKTMGFIEMTSVTNTGSLNFDIKYENTNQNPGEGVGRSPLHGIFEETFHAVDFELNRSTSGITEPDAQGKQFIGHVDGDQNHEARAWNFAANYAPFSPKLLRLNSNGVKANITRTLIQQIKALNSNPQNPSPQISNWLYNGFTVDVNRIAPTISEIQSIDRPPLYKK